MESKENISPKTPYEVTRQILQDNLRNSLDEPDPEILVVTPLITPTPVSPPPRGPPAYQPDFTPPAESNRTPPLSSRKVVETEYQRASFKRPDDASQNGKPSTLKEDDNSAPKAPDGGYGWVIVFAVFMIHVILDGTTFSFPVMVPYLVDKYEGGLAITSSVVSILMGMTFFCAPIASALVLKFGSQRVAVVSSLITFLGAALSFFATKIWHLAITYGAIMGIGFGGIYLPAIVTVATYFERRRATAMGLAVCGSGLGIFGFSKLIVILIEEYTIQGAFLVQSAIIFNVIIFAALLRPLQDPMRKKKRNKGKKTEAGSAVEMERLTKRELTDGDRVLHEETTTVVRDAPTASESKESKTGFAAVVESVRPIFRMWQYWVMLLVVFICGFSGYIPFTYLGDRAVKEAGVPKEETSTLISITGGFNLAGRLISGLLSDQKWCNRMLLYSSAYIISGINTVFSVLCTTFTAFAIYGSIYGFTGGILIALQSVILTDIVGIDNLSMAFGISLFILGIAALLGPPTAGAIVDAQGGYHVTFIIFGIIIGIGGCIFLIVPLNDFCRRCIRRWRGAHAANEPAGSVQA